MNWWKAVSDFFNRKKAEQNFYFALFIFCTRKKKAITSNKTREHWCSEISFSVLDKNVNTSSRTFFASSGFSWCSPSNSSALIKCHEILFLLGMLSMAFFKLLPFILKFVRFKKVYGDFLAVTFLKVWLCLCVKFTFVVIEKTMANFNGTIFEAPILVVKERCRALCLRPSDIKLGIRIL